MGAGLTIKNGLLSADGYTLPSATIDTRGGVKAASNQPWLDTTDLDGLIDAFNTLLLKLKAAGIMEADS